MEPRDLERIDGKLDKITEDLVEVNVKLAEYNEQLKIHIKRSDLLEMKLEPIAKHVTNVQAVAAFSGWLIGAAVAILTLISRFT